MNSVTAGTDRSLLLLETGCVRRTISDDIVEMLETGCSQVRVSGTRLRVLQRQSMNGRFGKAAPQRQSLP